MDLGTENGLQSPYAAAEAITDDINIEALLADDEPDDETASIPPATDSESLRRQADHLRLELREKMGAGLGEEVVRIRRLITETQDRIAAAEISEMRSGFDQATARLGEIAAEVEYVQSVKADNMKTLNERIADMDAAAAIVRRNEVAIELLKLEAESMRQSRREYRQRIQNFIEDADRILEGNYENF